MTVLPCLSNVTGRVPSATEMMPARPVKAMPV